MKRDMDLIRQILLEIEAHDDGRGDAFALHIAGLADATVFGHLMLLSDARLIDGERRQKPEGACFMPQRLTWTGQEFLSSIRDPSIWIETKKKIGDLIDGVTFDVVRDTASALARQSIATLEKISRQKSTRL